VENPSNAKGKNHGHQPATISRVLGYTPAAAYKRIKSPRNPNKGIYVLRPSLRLLRASASLRQKPGLYLAVNLEQLQQIPEAIVQRQMHSRQTDSVAQVLIKWSGMDPELATWEDAEALKQRFLQATTWGHAGSEGEGSVTIPHHGSDPDVQSRRSKRAQTRSKRVSSPQWDCSACAVQPKKEASP
jgi:hypothetical protein